MDSTKSVLVGLYKDTVQDINHSQEELHEALVRYSVDGTDTAKQKLHDAQLVYKRDTRNFENVSRALDEAGINLGV